MYRMILIAILVGAAVNVHAQDGDPVAGYVFAREAGNACHTVDVERRAPRRIVIGPAFRDIANTRGMTATALRVFLTTSHPKMPNLILTPTETADVIATFSASVIVRHPDRWQRFAAFPARTWDHELQGICA